MSSYLLGYARVSKADGSQPLDLQVDALREAGIDGERVYEDRMSGRHDQRPGLDACLKALRAGDTLCGNRRLTGTLRIG
jgi:DNA invertase Pin-like site-specific DNA recombinase